MRWLRRWGNTWDFLRQAREQEVDRAVRAALQGELDQDALDSISRIDQLIKVRNTDWVGPYGTGLLLAGAFAMSFLSLLDVPYATFQADLVVRGLSWDGAEETYLGDIDLPGLAGIDLSSYDRQGNLFELDCMLGADESNPAPPVHFSSAADGLALYPVRLRPGWSVQARWPGAGRPSEFGLDARGQGRVEVGLSLTGDVSVGTQLSTALCTDAADYVAFASDDALTLKLLPVGTLALLQDARVSRLSFHGADDVPAEGELDSVVRSRIVSGQLSFPGTSDVAVELRSGQHLGLDLRRGWIRELRLGDDGFTVSVVGEVEDVRVGLARKSVMPSVLQWVHANQGLRLYWASALYLFTLSITALRWWRST